MSPLTSESPAASRLEEDEALVHRLIRHDPASWQYLFDAYFRRVYGFAYLRTGDHHLAEDIAAEVFGEAAKGIRRFEYRGIAVGAWLFRIARNVTADHLTSRKKRQARSLEEFDVAAPALLSDLESLSDVRRAISTLTREQQEVVILRFFEDCSLAETARAVGKSVGAVKVIQHRAVAMLRKRMHLGPPGR